MFKFCCAVILILWLHPLHAQNPVSSNRFTLNGYVRDSLSGESIIGASISVNGESKGVASNQYGFYSITLDKGNYSINFSHVSYLGKTISIDLDSNQSFNADLISKSAAINEVIVYSRRRDANVKNAQMGRVELSMNQIRNNTQGIFRILLRSCQLIQLTKITV